MRNKPGRTGGSNHTQANGPSPSSAGAIVFDGTKEMVRLALAVVQFADRVRKTQTCTRSRSQAKADARRPIKVQAESTSMTGI